MDSNLSENLSGICKVLLKNNVDYLIVGGMAVALHGYFRVSITSLGIPTEKPDFDFWYNPSYKNYFNLLNALKELGQDVSAFEKETAPDPKSSFFKLELDLFTMDFLPSIPGISKFKNSYANREIATLNSVEISFICLDDLLTSKQATKRPQDINDIEQLKSKKK
ncbi:MAG: hypothetical protein K0Q79_2003 [Flavipsychrobacter sp.]|jgi:hypothetical protein|nr:hypothetical protein [Flavipsychrobacter sp.]